MPNKGPELDGGNFNLKMIGKAPRWSKSNKKLQVGSLSKSNSILRSRSGLKYKTLLVKITDKGKLFPVNKFNWKNN